MTTEEFIKLARKAGFVHGNPHSEIIVRHSSGAWVSIEERLHQFAILVAAAERDACAKVCFDTGLVHEVAAGSDLCFELEALIRARSNK